MLLTDLFKNIPLSLVASSSKGNLSPGKSTEKNGALAALLKIKIPSEIRIKSVVTDSRKTTKDCLFIALKGTQADGHRFLEDVIKRHPAAIAVESGRKIPASVTRSKVPVLAVANTRELSSQLADRWFGQPTRSLQVFGVTGTNGKTTSTQILATLLGPKELSGFLSTVKYRYADIEGYSDMTTPDPWTLHARFREMVDKGLKSCVMEVSSHALDQERVRSIRFRRNIFTNLTQDHLDYHKTIEKYFQAKQKLFLEIASDHDPVINKDDEYGKRIIQQLKKGRVVTYAVEDKSADYVAEQIALSMDETTFVLRAPRFSAEVKLPLLGRHNVYNFLAAVATAVEEGMSESELASRTRLIAPVSGRLEPIASNQRFRVFVDYAHTPDAMERILSFLSSLAKGKLITVFGCGGDRDRGKRPKMGRAAEKWSDVVIVTSDNPRSEAASAIIQDIQKGRKKSKDAGSGWIEIHERREAICKALSMAQEHDVVAVLGKGHENLQIIGKNRIPFSDQQVIRELLQAKAYALH